MSDPEPEQPTQVSAGSGVAASTESPGASNSVAERLAAVLRAADAKIAELTNAAEESRREADEYARDLRMAVEAYAKKHRQDAEEEARRLTDEADARAKSVLESAEEGARRIEEEARLQQEKQRAETQRLEQRRRRALNSVRELMAALEKLLEEPGHPAPTLDEALADPRRLGRDRP
jgi:DNA anti-recombination protein RmuC